MSSEVVSALLGGFLFFGFLISALIAVHKLLDFTVVRLRQHGRLVGQLIAGQQTREREADRWDEAAGSLQCTISFDCALCPKAARHGSALREGREPLCVCLFCTACRAACARQRRADCFAYSLASPGAPDSRCGLPGRAACPRQRIDHAPVQAAPSWTSIVPMNLNGDDLTDLLSYNAACGRAYFSVGVTGGTQRVVGAEATGAARWTSIVALKLSNGPGEAKDLLFYR